MTTITCKIPEKLGAQLEAMARQRRVSKSEIVRQAIEQKLKRKTGAPGPTAHDLAKSVMGSLHGPPDLSSNPRYMEGLGA